MSHILSAPSVRCHSRRAHPAWTSNAAVMTPRAPSSLLKAVLLVGLCVVASGAPTAAPPLLKKMKDSGPCRDDCESQVAQRMDKWLGPSRAPGARGGGKKVEGESQSCRRVKPSSVGPGVRAVGGHDFDMLFNLINRPPAFIQAGTLSRHLLVHAPSATAEGIRTRYLLPL